MVTWIDYLIEKKDCWLSYQKNTIKQSRWSKRERERDDHRSKNFVYALEFLGIWVFLSRFCILHWKSLVDRNNRKPRFYVLSTEKKRLDSKGRGFIWNHDGFWGFLFKNLKFLFKVCLCFMCWKHESGRRSSELTYQIFLIHKCNRSRGRFFTQTCTDSTATKFDRKLRKIILGGEVIWEELEAFETLDLDLM